MVRVVGFRGMTQPGTTSYTGPELGELIKERLIALGRSQQWLGDEVVRKTGLEVNIGQPGVSKWLKDLAVVLPARVFAIEELLEVPPGTYSQHLGYVPIGAPVFAGVEAAIGADPELDPDTAAIFLASYRAWVDRRRARRAEILNQRGGGEESTPGEIDPPNPGGKVTASRSRQRGGGRQSTKA